MDVPDTPLTTIEEDALSISAWLADLLRAQGWTCATAESCTGGTIGSWITALAGSSDYFMGGVITYSNAAKNQLLGVPETVLETAGAVSPECARAMAAGARKVFNTDIGIASTGVAGPGGATARKPVGLIYIAVSTPGGDEVRELRLAGNRRENIQETARQALDLAVTMLHMHQTDEME